MEYRNVTLTLGKAKEFYNSGNEALKEVALQAFTVEELKSVYFRDIKTFEDACKALNMNLKCVECDINRLSKVEGKLGNHLIAIYKLDIIRKALNGADWKPKMTEGNIYYSWVRFYLPNEKPSDMKTIATFRAGGQKYLLVGGSCGSGYYDGLGNFNSKLGHSCSYADLGLLCCKRPEIAQYMTEQFGKIIFDAYYAQHIGSYEWED